MRVLAFSDLHRARHAAGQLVEMSRDADLVIGAGDFTNHRQDLSGALDLIADIKAPMVLVPGNNESEDELRATAPAAVTVLHGEAFEFGGLQIFGLGYAVPETPFGEWSCDLSEVTAAAMLEQCQRADILISHSPPKGVVDVSSAGQSFGSTAVLSAIERIGPRLVVCGHIHDSWGQSAMVGQSRVVNLGPSGTWFDLEPLS
ncbi:metallophosphoesterase family protein [Shimia marina]|uniref:Calcineurin-like phosphoesterase superfamily domain protein n=1 Tax=Shimia marina TaxID=321267 RepID=A0A0P1FC15_9RHOB|nr:metallophosphoesterase [Shimia marina]CUH54233.1 Calcineurin-like phosphoesterase superfamily domain protein [Shimia marina]SFD98187.1 Predicted phosphoesterase [Shimia marina]